MSSVRIKKERHSPNRHKSKSRYRSRSRSREKARIKQEDDGSNQNGRHSKDSRRQDHRREKDEHRHRRRGEEKHRSRHREDGGRSRDTHRNEDGGGGNDQVRVKQEREHYDEERRQNRRHRPQNPFSNSEGEQEDWGHRQHPSSLQGETGSDEAPQERQKPNFGLSGKLTEDTNTYRGVVIKYNEPPEARVPKRRWRFYVFKGDETLPVLHLHRQSAYLLGRDRKIVDMPIDHPSCSKQHAVLQYRLVDVQREDGTIGRRVKPYVIDLESSNGTFLNNKQIEPKRYYELQEKDVLKFGFSTREYVLLHAQSKASDDEDFD